MGPLETDTVLGAAGANQQDNSKQYKKARAMFLVWGKVDEVHFFWVFEWERRWGNCLLGL
jgi:hypothetical protein